MKQKFIPQFSLLRAADTAKQMCNIRA